MCIFEHIAQFYFDLNFICLLKPDGFVVAIKEFIPFGVSSFCSLCQQSYLGSKANGSKLLGEHANGSQVGSRLVSPQPGTQKVKKVSQVGVSGSHIPPNKRRTMSPIHRMSQIHQMGHGMAQPEDDVLREKPFQPVLFMIIPICRPMQIQ
jgi:hypothetical protein